jgi:hypothetical protein
MCNLIECYSCLSGVYRSLLHGWSVDSLDIEEAVSGVCEELQPIEIDITNFILTSCRITHQLTDVGTLLSSVQQFDESSSPSATSTVQDQGSEDTVLSSDQ